MRYFLTFSIALVQTAVLHSWHAIGGLQSGAAFTSRQNGNDRPYCIRIKWKEQGDTGGRIKEMRHDRTSQAIDALQDPPEALPELLQDTLERRFKVKIPRSQDRRSQEDPQKQHIIRQGLEAFLRNEVNMMVHAHKVSQRGRKELNFHALAFEKESVKQPRKPILFVKEVKHRMHRFGHFQEYKFEEEDRGEAWNNAWKNYKHALSEHQQQTKTFTDRAKETFQMLQNLKTTCRDLRDCTIKTLGSKVVKEVIKDMAIPGIATQALKLVLKHCYSRLEMHQEINLMWLDRIRLSHAAMFGEMNDDFGTPGAFEKGLLAIEGKAADLEELRLCNEWGEKANIQEAKASRYWRYIAQIACLNEALRDYRWQLDPEHAVGVKYAMKHAMDDRIQFHKYLRMMRNNFRMIQETMQRQIKGKVAKSNAKWQDIRKANPR